MTSGQRRGMGPPIPTTRDVRWYGRPLTPRVAILGLVSAGLAVTAAVSGPAAIRAAILAMAVAVLGTAAWVAQQSPPDERMLSDLRFKLAMFEEAQQLAQVGSWRIDPNTGQVEWSAHLYRIFGMEPGEIPASTEAFLAMVHPNDRQELADKHGNLTELEMPHSKQYRIIRKDGEVRTVHSEITATWDPQGKMVAVLGTAQDVTERHAVQLQAAELATIVESSPDAVVRLNPHGVITSWSAGAERLFGYTAQQTVGRSGTMLIPPEMLDDPTHWHQGLVEGVARKIEPTAGHEGALLHQKGHTVPVALTISPIWDGEGTFTGAAIIARDITQQRQLEDQLTRQSLHDPLTGLANRDLLMEHLSGVLRRSREVGESAALIFIDLDDFKLVNDTIGHHAGDRLLMAVAGRLKTCARAHDMVARFGGDEFAIVIDSATETGVRQFADRLVSTLRPGVDLGGMMARAQASIGIAMLSYDSDDDAGTLLRKADLAMYAAKREEKGGYRIFADEIQSEFTFRVELEADLRNAVHNEQFHLHYQPIVALASGTITGFEALLRWNRPGRPPMGPDRFIPVLESTGLITQVGEFVLRQACRQAATWQSETGTRITISVNVSPPQLNAPGFVELVANTLQAAQLPADCLTLEITEGVMVANVEQVVTRLHRLRDLGVRMAIDDFGTGYSSLRYLQTLPVDTVKIDRSFIAKIQEGREQAALARAIVGVGHALNLSVVAEGVETAEQVRLLQMIGCEYGQGYHFARPQDPVAVSAMLSGVAT